MIRYIDALFRDRQLIAKFVGHVFQQTIGIPLDINCAPLLVDFIRELRTMNEKKLAIIILLYVPVYI